MTLDKARETKISEQIWTS